MFGECYGFVNLMAERDVDMNQIHLFCSANWSPDSERMLKPLQTILEHLQKESLVLRKVTIIRGNESQDKDYCAEVQRVLPDDVGFSSHIDDGRPAKVAKWLSKAAEEAAQEKAQLWVDLTQGPKPRTGVFFAAASAISQVRIVYAGRNKQGQYPVEDVPPLESYNEWLGMHGMRIRNYVEELRGLAQKSEAEDSKRFSAEKTLAAIPDVLSAAPGASSNALDVKSGLLVLAEWVANIAIPREIFSIQSPKGKDGRGKLQEKGKDWDDIIRDDANKTRDEWHRSAGRISQAIYQLRCLYAHDAGKEEDAVMLLDGLSFLAARLASPSMALVAQPSVKKKDMMFLAMDGDDVGRRFEEYLAQCVEDVQVETLLAWSQSIQRALSERIVELMDQCEGRFIARTGDGFLATFPAKHLDQLKETFQPKLAGTSVTATIGIGKSVKDAYLALKLGKARNRGGGLFFSLNPAKEEVLWEKES